MATNGETDDIDLETLQAQIDASLAQTFALVDSWKTPAFPQATSGRITEADFGAILRRPPRLGVGAAAPPPSAGNSHREIARLRGRLLGSTKSSREEEKHAASSTSQKPDDDDEEESRTGAIKKKARLDPFAAGKKKKKAVKVELDSFSQARSEPPALPMDVSSDHSVRVSSSQTTTVVDDKIASPPMVVGAVENDSTHKKRRRKNKRKGADAQSLVDGPGALLPLTSPVYAIATPSYPHSDGPVLTIPSERMEVDATADDPPLGVTRVDAQQPKVVDNLATSLLNLRGPPSEANGVSPTKKKRKRNKGKRKRNSHEGDAIAGDYTAIVEDMDE